MSSRTAKFASAIFASLIVGAPLTTISDSAAGADDECLSSPKDQAPQGGHWYYRIDRVTKRHCWYLKEDDEKPSQAAAKPVSPKVVAPFQRSIAEARAELPAQGRTEQPNQGNRLTSTDVAVSTMNRDTKPPVAEIPQTVIGSRWLGQSEADAANSATLLTNPTPLASPMPSSSVSNGPMANSNSPMANKVVSDTNLGAAAPTQPPSPPLAAGQFAADLSSATSAYPVQTLLAAMMGALALAGLLGRVIIKFVGPRRPASRRGRRGAIWKSAATGGRAASRVYPGADALPLGADFPRDLDEVNDPDDRIAELLRDFSRKSGKGKKLRQPSVGLFL
ncbi:MAG TPA: hypothetical protein VK635_13915 [Bradyrhizobium sp.]|jgi:hypothetical protein|nr:hypothetical protein [Bradyrhizobium sp.]